MPFTAAAIITGAKISAVTLAAEAAAIGGGVTAYSAYEQGKQQRELAKYSASMEARRAEEIAEASKYEGREQRKEARKLRAQQLVQFAKGGVVPTTGTPLVVGQETTVKSERDIRLMRYGYGLERSRALSSAALEKWSGKSKYRAGLWSGGTSLMTGVYRTASIYRN